LSARASLHARIGLSWIPIGGVRDVQTNTFQVTLCGRKVVALCHAAIAVHALGFLPHRDFLRELARAAGGTALAARLLLPLVRHVIPPRDHDDRRVMSVAVCARHPCRCAIALS
jgi:hypothetical protein